MPALEQSIVGDGPRDAHEPGTEEEKYAAMVPAAAAWIFAAGKNMYMEGDLSPNGEGWAGDPLECGQLWNGASGFSKERWAFWKKRFGDIVVYERLDEGTRKVAREAVAAMQRIEDEVKSGKGIF